VSAYALTELVSDVIAIADQLGQEKIFSRDMIGARRRLEHRPPVSAAHRQTRCPQRPHPSVMRKFLGTHPRQLLAVVHVLFQLPWLPEALFSSFNYRIAQDRCSAPAPGTFSPKISPNTAPRVTAGALTAMINWYRALFRIAPNFQTKPSAFPLASSGRTRRFLTDGNGS